MIQCFPNFIFSCITFASNGFCIHILRYAPLCTDRAANGVKSRFLHREPLNKLATAEQRIFSPIRAVQKTGNPYRIPPFSEPSAGEKSLAASSCRMIQSFHSMVILPHKPDFNRKNSIYKDPPVSASNPGTNSAPLSRTRIEAFLLCAVRPRIFCAGIIHRRISINLLIFSYCYGILHLERSVCRKEAMGWRTIQRNNGMPGKLN